MSSPERSALKRVRLKLTQMLLEDFAYLKSASHACADSLLAVLGAAPTAASSLASEEEEEEEDEKEEEEDGWRSRVRQSLTEETVGCSVRLPGASSSSSSSSSSSGSVLLVLDAELFDYDSPAHSEDFGAAGVELRVAGRTGDRVLRGEPRPVLLAPGGYTPCTVLGRTHPQRQQQQQQQQQQQRQQLYYKLPT